MEDNTLKNTIGILYPGEMGSSFGKLLAENGFRVVTTVEGRSPRTQRLCRDARLSVLESVGAVLERSDIIISLVPPGAALQVARNVAALVEGSSRRLLYIDANSVSPTTAVQISEMLRRGPIDFVDASIIGLASQLRQRGILYLSGYRAEDLSHQFAGLMRVKVAGDVPGQASAFRMIISGITKGLVGLFVETMLFARDMRLLSETLEMCDESYSGVMEVIRRLLPTYPQHAGRRGEELREVEQTMLLNGLTPRVVHAVREVITDLARVGWAKGSEPQQWTIAEIIEEVYRDGTLAHPGRGQGTTLEGIA
jgi:3-hydroxyisobutyrate dehydrogenase-like beta-hydroxyacid dehydrogenase